MNRHGYHSGLTAVSKAPIIEANEVHPRSNANEVVKPVFISDGERTVLHDHPYSEYTRFAWVLIAITILVVKHATNEYRPLT